ncbi:MAG: glycosyltransferase family 39 protein [Streptosporangiaceae bacterium]|jgi:4-amino-4-deoxy-L-arabinose transferase-like glycosyltransferase
MAVRNAGSCSPRVIGSRYSPGDGAFGSAGPRAGAGLPEALSHSPGVAQDHGGHAVIGGRAGPSWLRRLASRRWPLYAVLAVQAILSLRLVWSNTAFQDEALYLRAGHLEWARWLHQTPIPNFPAYFSGSPVIYPPLGAIADSVGGLAAARILSLFFMLGVTSLLWATAGRLYGQRAALLSAGLFATLAGTQFLGAFATFDAMALLLLTLATWLGVRASNCGPRPRTSLLLIAGVILAAADAVKYATVLFAPVVFAVVALAAWRKHRGRAWLAALLTMLGTWLMLIVAAIVAGGGGYWRGVTTSTLSRPQSDIPVRAVLQSSYIWTGLILVLAFLGVVLAARGETRGKLLPVVLAAAALLAPAGQALLHTTVSLQKHVVFGAWFAAIAAGYAMARMSRVDRGRGWAPVMALPIAAATLFGSMGQAASLYKVWPNAASVVSTLRSAIRSHPGNYLAEDYDVEAYYLRAEAPWPRWSSTYYFRYQDALPGGPSYATAIDRHYFSLVILDFGDTRAVDTKITADMRDAGGYYVLGRVGRFTIWASRAATLPRQSRGNHVRD